MPKCPVCDAAVDLTKTPTVPFCSDRCRLIDLGRWLDEGYSVPVPRRPDDEDSDGGDDTDAD
jgi:endogenous inhibitor of DNA gyrase (YacG/DUF329 family)